MHPVLNGYGVTIALLLVACTSTVEMNLDGGVSKTGGLYSGGNLGAGGVLGGEGGSIGSGGVKGSGGASSVSDASTVDAPRALDLPIDKTISSESPETGLVVPPLPVIAPIPTIEQVTWQRLELTAFFHFGTNTFTNLELGNGKASPQVFNPGALDTTQWVTTVKNAGFGMGILVAKHHDGFCLWPTKHTDYSVKQSPWKGGKGDVVREFADAAHKANLRVGLYLSPWDVHEPTNNTPAYNTYFKNLLTELLSDYGDIHELWFDGHKAPSFDWNAVYTLIRKMQPHALIAITGPDIRWVGSEDGIAPIGETSVQTGNPLVGQSSGKVWYPSESDVSIRPGWFWHPAEDTQVKTLTQLMDIYYGSVGRNSVLLLNIPPNTKGLLSDPDVAVLEKFGGAIRSLYQTNLALGKAITADTSFENNPAYASSNAVDGELATYWAAGQGKTTGRLEIDMGAAVLFNTISIREPIELGERTSRYHVEILIAGGWSTVASGNVIGQRNLLRIATSNAQKIALVLDQARGIPAIAEFGVFQSQ